MRADKEKWTYYLVRAATVPFAHLPYSWIRCVGKVLGTLAYYVLPSYRKRALSNLALATDLKLNERQLHTYAKQAFQNLAINCLEYAKFANEKDFSRVIQCENPETANALYAKGQGIIFFCAHQSNWEALFLDGTSRMKGIAIGKSIKNKRLYNWIVSIREKNGGKIIGPRSAMKESLRALRNGVFVGIVGDQGMPDSGYSFPFFGRRAWNSTAPALLAYKTHSPIIVASTRRTPGGYRIRYSDPIWPDLSQPLESDVIRMMDKALTLLQESIQLSPGEWFWQHNRWKQQTMVNLYRRFRQDCICVILPEKGFPDFVPHLETLKQIYHSEFLVFLVPQKQRHIPLPAAEIIYYNVPSETLLKDYRFKLVFNFTDYKPIHKHYERLSALEVLDLPTIKEKTEYYQETDTLSDMLKRVLCRPGLFWRKEDYAR